MGLRQKLGLRAEDRDRLDLIRLDMRASAGWRLELVASKISGDIVSIRDLKKIVYFKSSATILHHQYLFVVQGGGDVVGFAI